MKKNEQTARADRARAILKSASNNFCKLFELAGLDPTRHARYADWSGVSFAGCDLAGYDFTGARLCDCDFRGAKLTGARFDQAVLGKVHSISEEAHGPGETTGIANLRAAQDYDDFCKNWQAPESLPPDDDLTPGCIFQDAPFSPQTVVVPAGSYVMGAGFLFRDRDGQLDHSEPDSLSEHVVTIDYSFAVGRFPITTREWNTVLRRRFLSGSHFRIRPPDPSYEIIEDRPLDSPVTTISWNAASQYCFDLSEETGKQYRLLSEAEWEYVCRAGGPSIKGAGFRSKPHPWGIMDMGVGLVEWCEDTWHCPFHIHDVSTDETAPWQAADAPTDGSAWVNKGWGFHDEWGEDELVDELEEGFYRVQRLGPSRRRKERPDFDPCDFECGDDLACLRVARTLV